uniref:Uncharacterized LOC100175956 n=1 Tax=Ciona intestinalis TaxID=7719 RepID=F6SHP7_CIOIN
MGNIHVYDLVTFDRVCMIPTHDGDILCIDYSTDGKILASAGRDRCVNTFGEGYAPTHTISDHSAAVTAAKFAHHENELILVTCGSDKSIYFCSITTTHNHSEVNREQHCVEKYSMNDMEVLGDTVLVACGSNLIEFDLSGKLRRTIRPNDSTATILRVAVDNQRTMVAAASSDKNDGGLRNPR